ncbi:hypothetical protein llap_14244 [Limosa lapponica baueri]|uniref:Uncharacterized protein n=1 Tax=Limosa lapponica baueri TaxID=1758121 RepID=A0A2I0TNT8_LIMLA|nr:hypothetical protein llap_14244 [Limosa lapponica baueri]
MIAVMFRDKKAQRKNQNGPRVTQLVRHVSRTTELGVCIKLAKGALDPTVYVIDEDIKQFWSQYGPLRDTTHYQSPSGY